VLSEQLLARLPRLTHCNIGVDSGAALLSRSVQPSREDAQLGFGAVLGKLSELLLVDAIRAYVESMSQHEGWLTGLKDRYVSRGLALMYGRPSEHWTVESLARKVGVSRTALADHFVRCTGMAPMPKLRASDRLRLSPAPSGASSVFRRTGGGEISVAASVPLLLATIRQSSARRPTTWRKVCRPTRKLGEAVCPSTSSAAIG